MRSPTDPDATWASKGGPARFAYYVNYLVDNARGVIVEVEAAAARYSAEALAARTMVERTRAALALPVTALGADRAYGNGPFLDWCRAAGVTAYVPVLDRRGQMRGHSTRADFAYDAGRDEYVYPGGERLRRVATIAATQVQQYRAPPARCAACVLRGRCTSAPRRQLSVSGHGSRYAMQSGATCWRWRPRPSSRGRRGRARRSRRASRSSSASCTCDACGGAACRARPNHSSSRRPRSTANGSHSRSRRRAWCTTHQRVRGGREDGPATCACWMSELGGVIRRRRRPSPAARRRSPALTRRRSGRRRRPRAPIRRTASRGRPASPPRGGARAPRPVPPLWRSALGKDRPTRARGTRPG